MSSIPKLAPLALAGALFLCHLPNSYAQGGVAGGGGNVVLCPGKPGLVLDYYNAGLATIDGQAPDLIDVSSMSEADAITAVKNQLGTFFMLRPELDEMLKNVGPIGGWTSADLHQVDDSGEPYLLPNGCVRRTAAFRQGRELPITMYADPGVLSQLSPGQRGVLRVHEAFYLMGTLDKDVRSSTPVRDLMRELLKKNPDRLVLYERLAKISNHPAYYDGVKGIASGVYYLSEAGELFEKTSNKARFIVDESTGHVSFVNLSRLHFPKSAEFDCSNQQLMKSTNEWGSWCRQISSRPTDQTFMLYIDSDGGVCGDNGTHFRIQNSAADSARHALRKISRRCELG